MLLGGTGPLWARLEAAGGRSRAIAGVPVHGLAGEKIVALRGSMAVAVRQHAFGPLIALDKHGGGRLHSDEEDEMGPQSLGALLEMMSPMIWLCVGTVVLVVVLIRTLILKD